MSSETWAVVGVGVALLGVLVPLLLSLRGEMAQVRDEVSQVRRDLHSLAERVARIEGALSGPYRLPAPEGPEGFTTERL